MLIELKSQRGKAELAANHFDKIREEVEKRFPIWQQMNQHQRLAWIKAAEKDDPLFHLFVEFARYCEKWGIPDVA